MKVQIDLFDRPHPDFHRRPKHEIEPGDVVEAMCQCCGGTGELPWPHKKGIVCQKCHGKGVVKEVL